MISTNRVLGEIANVINDKVKRKPLATISIKSTKTDIIVNQVKEVKVGAVEKPKEARKSEPKPDEKENCENQRLSVEIFESQDGADEKSEKKPKLVLESEDKENCENQCLNVETRDSQVGAGEELEEEIKLVFESEDKENFENLSLSIETIVSQDCTGEKFEEELKLVTESEDKEIQCLNVETTDLQVGDISKDQAKEVKVGAVERPKEAPKSEPKPDEKENCENQCLSVETFEPPKDDWCYRQTLEIPEYDIEIQKYLLLFQLKNRADPTYLTKNDQINGRMRTILIDWMVEVVDEYEMTPETLFLSVNFVDRYLSSFGITRDKFQLLGTASLFISSKYEEIYPPDVHEFVYITDNAYEKHDILKMEIEILKALSFCISTPTIHYFLINHLNSLNLPQKVGIMAEYLAHLALTECDPCITYFPNDVAISAILLSTQIFGIKLELSGEIGQTFFPSYSAEQLKAHLVKLQPCIDTLRRIRKTIKEENDALFKSGKPQQAIFNKYAQEKYFCVSLLSIED